MASISNPPILWDCPYNSWQLLWRLFPTPPILWDCPYNIWQLLLRLFSTPPILWDCPYNIWQLLWRLFPKPPILWDCPYNIWQLLWRLSIHFPLFRLLQASTQYILYSWADLVTSHTHYRVAQVGTENSTLQVEERKIRNKAKFVDNFCLNFKSREKKLFKTLFFTKSKFTLQILLHLSINNSWHSIFLPCSSELSYRGGRACVTPSPPPLCVAHPRPPRPVYKKGQWLLLRKSFLLGEQPGLDLPLDAPDCVHHGRVAIHHVRDREVRHTLREHFS